MLHVIQDDEIRARYSERSGVEYNVKRDWSNPDCQSQVPFGPNAAANDITHMK